MRIEKIRIKNYKVFQELTSPVLGGINVFTGPSGSGKSTFLDVLDFLRDAITTSVGQAVQKRGGFDTLSSKNGGGEDIEIELYIAVKKETSSSYNQLIYLLQIGQKVGKTLIRKEVLKQYSQLLDSEKVLLEVKDGFGKVANKKDGLIETMLFELEERDKLSIGIVGEVRGYPAVTALRKLLSSWEVIDFAKEGFPNTHQLAYWTKLLEQQQPVVLEQLLKKIQRVIPEIEQISTTETIDGRILLQFKEGGIDVPFTATCIAKGHLKLWGFLLLLNLPHPALLLGIESPEHNLHSNMLDLLVEEFRAYTKNGGQLLITSYSSTFMDTLRLEELFGISKRAGQSSIQAAKDDVIVQKGYEIGESLGRLWS